MLRALEKFLPHEVVVHGVMEWLPPDLSEFFELELCPISYYLEPEYLERLKFCDPIRMIGGWEDLLKKKITRWSDLVAESKKVPIIKWGSGFYEEPRYSRQMIIGKQFFIKIKNSKAAHEVARRTGKKLTCLCDVANCDHKSCKCRCRYFLGKDYDLKVRLRNNFFDTEINNEDNYVCFLAVTNSKGFNIMKRSKFSVWLFHNGLPVAQVV